MIKMKKINYSLLIFPIISLIGGAWQGQYVYDGYHWGFVFSNALDILEGKMPYKEIFLEYGVVMPLIHAITLFCFNKNIFSLIIVTSLFYSMSIYLIGVITQKFTLNKYYSFFATFVIFIIYPWPTQPWHNYISFFFATLFCLLYLSKKKIYLIFSGVSLGLAYLTNTIIWNFIIIFFITILISLTLFLKSKLNEKFIQKNIIFITSFLATLSVFLFFLLSNNLLDLWLLYQKLPFIFNEGTDQVSIYTRIVNYLLFLTVFPIKNFITEPQWIIFALIFYTNLFFIIKAIVYFYKKNYKDINIEFLVINFLILSLSFYAQLINLEALATSLSLGIISLMVLISNLRSHDTKIITNFCITFVCVYSLLFAYGLNQSKYSGQRYTHLGDLKNINKKYNEHKIKYFINQKWSKNTWYTLNTFMEVQTKLKKNCNLEYGANLTSNSFIYSLLEYKKIQITPYVFKNYDEILRNYFEPRLLAQLQHEVNKSNIVIVSFENNDKLLKLDNYAEPVKINLNAYNKQINEYMYIYFPKKCGSI